MATTSDLKTGNIIRYNDDLCEVIEYQHINPGNWRAFVRLRLKSLKTGRVVEDRVRAGSEIDLVRSGFKAVSKRSASSCSPSRATAMTSCSWTQRHSNRLW